MLAVASVLVFVQSQYRCPISCFSCGVERGQQVSCACNVASAPIAPGRFFGGLLFSGAGGAIGLAEGGWNCRSCRGGESRHGLQFIGQSFHQPLNRVGDSSV